MSRQLSELAKLMFDISDDIVANIEKGQRDVAIAIGGILIPATPVKTSRARANWQSSLNTPATGVLFPKPLKPPSDSAGSAMAISSLRAVTVTFKAGMTLYIVNNLSYIRELNAGTSTQAPAGFVLMAVNVGIRTVQQIRVLRP